MKSLLVGGGRLACRYVVGGGMPLHVPAVHLDDTGEENGKESDEQKGEGKKVFAGEVAHKCQPCSTASDTIVK